MNNEHNFKIDNGVPESIPLVYEFCPSLQPLLGTWPNGIE